jgi:N-acetylmuramoyl-L-alanine amidase
LLFGFWRLRPATESAAPGLAVPAAAAADDAAGDPAAAAPPPALTTTQLTPIGAEVFGLGIRRIMLDPGHGGSDTGTTVGGLMEKELTLDIALKLKERLEKAGFEVHMTRSSDLTLTLRERSEMANLLGAHLFVSVHINYLPGGRDSRGVETYFVGATDDPELLELAKRENAHSGYDMASNNQLLQKLFTDARQQNSQVFARRVQQLLFSSLKPANPGLVDRGVKQAPFVVLVGTTMPAILAEVACLSSATEAELLARPLYRDSIAEALARGIRKYADDVNPSQEKGS